MGKFVVDSLLKTGKHTVTAITREDSTSTLPSGVQVAKVNYDDPSTLVQALKGQDALIITMGVTAPPEQQSKLIEAAAEAAVPYVLPNEWGNDSSKEQLGKDTFLGPRLAGYRAQIESLGKSAWIAVCCGFWYEYSLGGGPDKYGFNFKKQELTLFDDGNERITTSTWVQTGRGVAALLSLNEEKLAQFRNNWYYVSSFTLSQREMFESVLKVTGASEKDWKVTSEPSGPRYKSGLELFQSGDRLGFVRFLYTRVFFPTGEGDYSYKSHNQLLGLPQEDLEEATKRAVEMVDELGGH